LRKVKKVNAGTLVFGGQGGVLDTVGKGKQNARIAGRRRYGRLIFIFKVVI
jgi:hypothetical protein